MAKIAKIYPTWNSKLFFNSSGTLLSSSSFFFSITMRIIMLNALDALDSHKWIEWSPEILNSNSHESTSSQLSIHWLALTCSEEKWNFDLKISQLTEPEELSFVVELLRFPIHHFVLLFSSFPKVPFFLSARQATAPTHRQAHNYAKVAKRFIHKTTLNGIYIVISPFFPTMNVIEALGA